MIAPSVAVSRYRTTMAFAYDAAGTVRKRPTKDPAGLRPGSHTLAVWCVIAPSSATASSPWTIRSAVVMPSPPLSGHIAQIGVAAQHRVERTKKQGGAMRTAVKTYVPIAAVLAVFVAILVMVVAATPGAAQFDPKPQALIRPVVALVALTALVWCLMVAW